MRQSRLAFALPLLLALLLPVAGAGAASDPTSPAEQLWIYDLNLMRWNPAAYGINGAPTEPLAVNGSLAAATNTKAAYMVDPPGSPSLYCGHAQPAWSNQLAVNHGFPLPSWWGLSSNFIEATWCSSGASAMPSAMAFVTSSSQWHRDIVLGRGWYENHREVGVGYDTTAVAGFSFMAAPRLGYDAPWEPHPPIFVTGVVFDDYNGNGRMDLGEGRAGATVNVGPHQATTNAGGGYAVLIEVANAGDYAVSSPGAGSDSVTITNQNVTVDFVMGRTEAIVRMPAAAQRWWGSNRYTTAVAVSQQTHPSGANTVYLAVGTNYPDAVAAGPAAAAENAPILLTPGTYLHETTRNELQRLGPNRVVILGGTAAINSSVEAAVRSAVPSANVTRRWGATRYETAVDISKGAFGPSTSTVYVATGEGFPDAVVAAPAAIDDGASLLLVKPFELPQAVRDELSRLSPSKIVVVGGPGAVGSSVFNALKAYAGTVTRVSAPDRYTLSAEISKLHFTPQADTVYVAVGDKYPDALSGGPATDKAPGPILLVSPWDVPPAVGAELLRLAPHNIVILGGTSAVSAGIAAELSAYIAG